ncbi:MAG: M20/M25/M40 family metallo-hydrolase [Ardenticatenaceae bacterium]|nr:M20/M25/M40 family metallo-hydrolase [Ardenticatenaceae bacterium]
MLDTAIHDLLTLLPIPGPPAQEKAVADFLQQTLVAMGIPHNQICYDRAQDQSEYGGNVGNLIVKIAGKQTGPTLMFSTHMDTVPDCVGCQPRLDREGSRIINDAPGTALGGDNRAGCAILLTLARRLMTLAGEHPPIVLVFFVQEEVGLVGARGLDVTLLGEDLPAMCVNLDGGRVAEVVTAVIGSQRFTIDITGVAAHAGSRVAEGVSAAIIASQAIAELAQAGWHGRIQKPEGRGTANVGILEGGKGSNVVMPALHILAEARSHNPHFRRLIIDTWQTAFRRAAQNVTNIHGEQGAVVFGPGPTYEAYSLPDDAPVVRQVQQAAALIGLPIKLVSDDGGMDANWVVAHGIPCVTLNIGQRDIHTPHEWIDLHDFERACQLVIAIATTQKVAG